VKAPVDRDVVVAIIGLRFDDDASPTTAEDSHTQNDDYNTLRIKYQSLVTQM